MLLKFEREAREFCHILLGDQQHVLLALVNRATCVQSCITDRFDLIAGTGVFHIQAR